MQVRLYDRVRFVLTNDFVKQGSPLTAHVQGQSVSVSSATASASEAAHQRSRVTVIDLTATPDESFGNGANEPAVSEQNVLEVTLSTGSLICHI